MQPLMVRMVVMAMIMIGCFGLKVFRTFQPPAGGRRAEESVTKTPQVSWIFTSDAPEGESHIFLGWRRPASKCAP